MQCVRLPGLSDCSLPKAAIKINYHSDTRTAVKILQGGNTASALHIFAPTVTVFCALKHFKMA